MRRKRLVLLLAAGLVAGLFSPLPAAAAATTLYVDGKTGNDGNSGLSAGTAFKTIAKATSMIPSGTAAGWTVIVKGYTDYIYRERPIPSGFSSAGTAAAHITFKASGYAAGSTAPYVKPIVSGGAIAPAAGQSWSPSGRAGIWKTSWSTEPYWFGRLTWTLKTAIFQNGTTWLWEQTSLDTLAARASGGKGGYWWDRAAKILYVSAVGAPAAGTDPSKYKIEVIVRPTFYFEGTRGVRYVDVRGFEVWHSANGITFDNGTDYSVAADNIVSGNFLMGLDVAGQQTPSGPDQAVGNTLARNRGAWNTLQLIKLDEGTQDATVCDNVGTDNALRGIFVQGKAPGTTYTGFTSNVLLCRNKMYGHDFNPTGSIYNNASGITVANAARNVTLDGNELWANDVGIHITQERSGLAPLDNIVLKNNRSWGNRRFGLNLYDGAYASGDGKVTVSRDMYWDNGTGVMVSQGSTNKTISQSTIHDNAGDGIRVGVANQAASRLTLTKSLLTSNGGYGLLLVTGSTATISYNGLPGNASGSIKGTPSQTATNTQAAGYLSTSAGSSTFLKISTSSYQYTAGPSRTPIGARY